MTKPGVYSFHAVGEDGTDFVLTLENDRLVRVNGRDIRMLGPYVLIGALRAVTDELLRREKDDAAAAKLYGVRANRGALMSNARFKQLWEDKTITATDIGKMLGITGAAVHMRAKVRGLGNRTCNKKRMTIQYNRVIYDPEFPIFWRMGVSFPDLTAHYGFKTQRPLSNARVDLGLPDRKRADRHNKISVQGARVRMALHNKNLTDYDRHGIMSDEVKVALWEMRGVK